MKKALVTLILILICLPLAAENQEEAEAMIFPGETLNLLNINITWKVTEEITITEKNGLLDLTGPDHSFRDVPVFDFSFPVYLDGTFIKFRPQLKSPGNIKSITLEAGKSPDQVKVSSSPEEDYIYLSSPCPSTLNEWKISVSEQPEPMPYGRSYHIITMKNSETGETTTMPASERAFREIGRFTIKVVVFHPPTRTVVLAYKAKPDPSEPDPKVSEEMDVQKTKLAEIEDFYRERELLTNVYHVAPLDLDTAEDIIEPFLRKTSLVLYKERNKPTQYFIDYNVNYSEKRDGSTIYKNLATQEEKIVKDRENNTLIVLAMKDTHDKIEKALGRITETLKTGEPKQSEPLRIHITLLEGKKNGKDNQEEIRKTANLYGIEMKDLETFGFDSLERVGGGMVNLMQEKGELGTATVSVGKNLMASVKYIDFRKPYVILRGGLMARVKQADSDQGKILDDPAVRKYIGMEDSVKEKILENTLYLTPGKPVPLGITNYKEGYILVILVDEL